MRLLLCISILLFGTTSCKLQPDHPTEPLTDIQWSEDLDFLQKKIQKEFASFDADVITAFPRSIDNLKSQLGSLDEQAIKIEIGRIMAELGDGHTEMSILQRSVGFSRLPLVLYFFEEGLFIAAAHEEYRLTIGAEVLKIGTAPVQEIFNELKKIMTMDNEYEILETGPYFMGVPEVLKHLNVVHNLEKVNFTMRMTNGEIESRDIRALHVTEYLEGPWLRYREINNVDTPLYAKEVENDNWIEYLEVDKTLYLHFGYNGDRKGQPSAKRIFRDLFDKIDDVKPDKLVIDLRHNRGGNYHKSNPLIEGIKKRSWLNEKGKIYVITGRMTFSAAMVTSIFLKNETNGLLIGEPSRGHPNKCDNVEFMTLPNSQLNIEYTTKVKKHWPELGDADHVPVDIPINLSFSNYSNGIDPVMQYILDK